MPETCCALAPWLRFVRVNQQDLIPMIRSKTSWLSNSLSKYLVGLYNTDTATLLKEQRNASKVKDKKGSGLFINPNSISNEFEFTNERIAHLVVQLCLPLVYSSFNPINVLHCIVFYLGNNHSMLQSICTNYTPNASLGADLLTYIQGLKSLSVFDRLIACKYLLLDRIPSTFTQPLSNSGGPFFIHGVEYFPSLDALLPFLVMYGNYAVAAAYQKESNFLFSLQYYLFVPNTTALEVAEYMYIHEKRHVYDVQWRNGVLGCIVPVFVLHDKEITKSNIVRLYSSSSTTKQPNFLLAIMSWFANHKNFVPVTTTTTGSSGSLTEAELQDLDTFANNNLVIMNQIYYCWEFKPRIDLVTGKAIKRQPITAGFNHDWENLKKWLLCVGEVIRVFVRCLLGEKGRVFTAGGIFSDSVSYYNKGSEGGAWETQDTEVLIKLMKFVAHLYGATKVAYRQLNTNKNATEQDKRSAMWHLIQVMCCFYHDDLDILNLADNGHYYEEDVGDIMDAVQSRFADKRVIVQPTQEHERDAEEDATVEEGVADHWTIVRIAMALVLDMKVDGPEMDQIKKWTGKYVPFIVYDAASQGGTRPVLLGSQAASAGLVVDCFPCIKAKDVSQIMTSIIRNDIHIDTVHIKPFLLRVFNNTARAHVLEPPRQLAGAGTASSPTSASLSSSSSSSSALTSSKRNVYSYDNIAPHHHKRHKGSSSLAVTSSQEEECEPDWLEEYDPSVPDMMNDTTTAASGSLPTLTSRIQLYGRG